MTPAGWVDQTRPAGKIIPIRALDASAPAATPAAMAAARPVTARRAMVVSARQLASDVGADITDPAIERMAGVSGVIRTPRDRLPP